MARLSFLGIAARDPKALAGFYESVFGLENLQSTDRYASLSDGFSQIGLLPVTDSRRQGLCEMGFRVEEPKRVEQRLRECAPAISLQAPPGDDPAAEFAMTDIDGVSLILCKEEPGASDAETPVPFRHIALYTPNPGRLADFYTRVFDMKKVATTDRSSIFVSDGRVNLALLYERPGEEELGLNHFGFHVRDNQKAQGLVGRFGGDPGKPRPKRIPFSEFRVHDPEGNGIDLSERGWKV